VENEHLENLSSKTKIKLLVQKYNLKILYKYNNIVDINKLWEHGGRTEENNIPEVNFKSQITMN
jgi:hypothetical protein